MTVCPRCEGLLFWCDDQHGRYLTCLMCGFVRDEPGVGHDQLQWEVNALRRRGPRHGNRKDALQL